MSERTLVCLGTLSLGELKTRSGTRRRNARGRIVILTLTVALGVRVTLALPLAFTFDIGMGRSSNVSSRNSGRGTSGGRPLPIRIMPVVTLGSFLTTTLVHPLGTMLLTRVCRSSSRGLSREPRLDGFLILTLTPDCNLPVSLRHQVAVRTRLITRVSRVISIESMLHAIAITKLFEKVLPQEVLIN